MATFYGVFLSLIVLLTVGTQSGQTLRVEFYKEENYSGFAEDDIISGENELACVNLKYPDRLIKSVKTNKCLIVYAVKNCTSYFVPTRGQDPTTYVHSSRIDNDTPKLPRPQTVNSFHVCSQKHAGGPQLDLDVHKVTETSPGNYGYGGYDRYRGVCGCRNLQSWVSEKITFNMPTIDNYGNSINLYAEEHCQGELKNVPAGQGPDSWTLNKLPFGVKSFKPAELKHCYRLEAKIHKFQFTNGTDSLSDLDVEKVHIATSADLKNNGSEEITQAYKLSSKLTDTVEYSVAESLTEVSNVGVEVGAEITIQAGVPGVGSKEFKASLKTNYQYTRTDGSEKANKTTTAREEAIEIEQQIKIPACKVCTVTTYVKKVKGFVIKYKAYANIRAPASTAPMTVAELKDNLPAGLDFVRVVDAETIEAVTDGTMNTDFGIKSLVDVDCVVLPNCATTTSYFNVMADDRQSYESPLHVVGYQGSGTAPSSNSPDFLSFLKNAIATVIKHFN